MLEAEPCLGTRAGSEGSSAAWARGCRLSSERAQRIKLEGWRTRSSVVMRCGLERSEALVAQLEHVFAQHLFAALDPHPAA